MRNYCTADVITACIDRGIVIKEIQFITSYLYDRRKEGTDRHMIHEDTNDRTRTRLQIQSKAVGREDKTGVQEPEH